MPQGLRLSANQARPGDVVILSGAIGDHGMAIMASREGLEFETTIVSDSAPLHRLVADMLVAGSTAFVVCGIRRAAGCRAR